MVRYTMGGRKIKDEISESEKVSAEVLNENTFASAEKKNEDESNRNISVKRDETDIDFETFLIRSSPAYEKLLRDIYLSLPGNNVLETCRNDVNLSGSGIAVPSRKGVKVMITGSAFGIPGSFTNVFSDSNFGILMEGRNLIEPIDENFFKKFIEKGITRLDKKPDGSAELIRLDDSSKVVHLAGKLGGFDLGEEFGVPKELVNVLDISSQLVFAAGLLALKDAGIPLVKKYFQTTTGSFLPEKWELPSEMQEDTGIIFASAFPGYDSLINQISEFYTSRISQSVGEERDRIYGILKERIRGTDLERDLDKWYKEASAEMTRPYELPRYLIFMTLSMGHSQFAQYIKAKGPNTQVNSACASSTLGAAIAQDWIQSGRCKRVIVLGGDAPSTDRMLEWMGSGMLSLGALTTEKDVRKAAIPFGKNRNGLILGAGASALILEAEEEPERRGMNPITELLGSHIGNSAFHGSRLDVAHIARSLDKFISKMEREHEIKREDLPSDMLFMSHETYTPARGGSSAAEAESLSRTFGEMAKEILIINTKGYTGHAFGACIEDPLLVKCLDKGVAFPIANLNEVDEQFEGFNLSRGGEHNRHYGLRLAAGFGSQLAFLLMKRSDTREKFSSKEKYEKWLGSITTTQPADLEVIQNVLRLKDHGRKNLISHRAIRKESSKIGYDKKESRIKEDEDFEKIKDQILLIINRKIGIPLEKLDVDADLKLDLGVDSVTHVELFASVRIHFKLPKDEGVYLRNYPTIRDIIKYILVQQSPLKQEQRGDYVK